MNFRELLKESINDKYLFKAIFMAGGPGSGKSFVNKKMFGGIQAKVVNSDDIFEKKLKALNLGSLLYEAENDISTGKIRPVEEFLEEF